MATLIFAILLGIGSNLPLSAQSESLDILVLQADDIPVTGAEVELFEWVGVVKSTKFRARTDASGRCTFDGFRTNSQPFVIVRHPDFAPALQQFTTSDKQTPLVTCRLSPSLTSSITVVSPEGKPLSGAEVVLLDYFSQSTGIKTVLDNNMIREMMHTDNDAFVSDDSGRLTLLPLPKDAVLKLSVTHPDWAVGKTEEIPLSEVASKPIHVKRGTRIDARFVGSRGALDKLNGKRVLLRTFDRAENRLMHAYQVVDDKIHFTLPAGQFDGLHLIADGVLITPSLGSGLKPIEFWNIPNVDQIQKGFVVRELNPVVGRVVTSEGIPVAGATVEFDFANLFIDDSGRQQTVKEQPTTSIFFETDKDGYYNAEIPLGESKMTVAWSGYYSEPATKAVEFTGQAKLDDYVVKPMPVVKGRVVDEEGHAIPRAVVRFLKMFNEAEYVVADSKGNYSVEVEEFDFDPETLSRSTRLTIVAFDLNSELCCIEKINVSEPELIADFPLTLRKHAPPWLYDEMVALGKSFHQKMVNAGVYPEASADGDVEAELAVMAPDFSGGTWFNTDARSLGDFRGKYVLLDFWFIGCGPCEREMPDVKLLHDSFQNQNFTVLSIHIAGQAPETVKQFARDSGMTYPLVVDSADGAILKAFQKHGVRGFPSYVLIDPAGRTLPSQGLRTFKLEILRELMLEKFAGENGH